MPKFTHKPYIVWGLLQSCKLLVPIMLLKIKNYLLLLHIISKTCCITLTSVVKRPSRLISTLGFTAASLIDKNWIKIDIQISRWINQSCIIFFDLTSSFNQIIAYRKKFISSWIEKLQFYQNLSRKRKTITATTSGWALGIQSYIGMHYM